MRLYPTALLTGLLLTFLSSSVPGHQLNAQQLPQAADAGSTTQLAKTDIRTFHRGSGRCQFLATAMLATSVA